MRGEIRQISTAYFVYVAIDQDGKSTPVKPLEPTTLEQRQRWHAAEGRRARRMQHRLESAATTQA
jgi:acyl-CoA hydrolase